MPFSMRNGHSVGAPSRAAVILSVVALVVAGAISAGMVIGALVYATSDSERAGGTPASASMPEAGESTADASSGAPESAAPTSGDSRGSSSTAADQGASVAEPKVGIVLAEATVVRVIDGDTAVFRLQSGATEKTRFIGVDTPESTNSIEQYGREAAAYTKRALATGQTVFLERDVEERDRYGRLLAYVWLEEPTSVDETAIRLHMLNARLALDGYAQQMTIQPNSKYAEYFREFVGEARAQGTGLWGLEPESDPGDSEGANAALSDSAYIGNRNTKKFHVPSCSSVGDMNPSNKVPLSSRADAIAGGFVPCGRCRP